MKIAITVAGRARGPYGMPNRRIVGSSPYSSAYELQYISPASFEAV
jgi:hypothetical protein